jgi:hypothetical protein
LKLKLLCTKIIRKKKNETNTKIVGDKHPPTTPSVKGGGVGELRSLRTKTKKIPE